MKYPKTKNLYKQDPETKDILSEYTMEEFSSVCRWHVSEKVDGTNYRIYLNADGSAKYKGRTDKAVHSPYIIDYFDNVFPWDKLKEHFKMEDGSYKELVMFGELYGPKIQKGHLYSKEINFAVFDIVIGRFWLTAQSISELASELGLDNPPVLSESATLEEVIKIAIDTKQSKLTDRNLGDTEYETEGIIARSQPLMLTRAGDRVMFKLKRRDLKKLGDVE